MSSVVVSDVTSFTTNITFDDGLTQQTFLDGL